MRVNWVGCSIIAMAIGLSGCVQKSDQTSATSTTEANGQATWTRATADQLRQAIAGRATHALDHVQFAADGAPGSQNGDAALTKAALAYAAALAHGATDPTKLYDIYTVARPNPDLKRGLAEALRSGRVADWLNGLAPNDANYKRLSQAYLALGRGAGQPTAQIPDTGTAIKPGASDPRVPAIARQLASADYLAQPSASKRYAPAMVRAVRTLQADYGLKPDGIIGSEVLGILNLSPADQARAIAVNMERLRWLERNPPATRIDVNIAAARLSYWRDGKLVDSRKVVVGEPDKATPQLGTKMFRLVANPTWTVPRSVQQKEIDGKGDAYLKAHDMAWKDGWIVQKSGPKNSLGLVKFDLNNDQSIYLHDTPAKALFSLVQRQRSHGCVRVDDALGFADMIAQDEGVTNEWQKARAGQDETNVKLPREIPVRLLYQTVLFDETGAPIVRTDPYDWNDRVATALGFPAEPGQRIKGADADEGP